MTKIGFITIGVPNITGSFILNIPGPKDILPISFNCLLLAIKAIKNTKLKVRPDPPNLEA